MPEFVRIRNYTVNLDEVLHARDHAMFSGDPATPFKGLRIEFIRKGDELVVTRIDRLARSIGDLQDIVRTLQAKGATLRNNGFVTPTSARTASRRSNRPAWWKNPCPSRVFGQLRLMHK